MPSLTRKQPICPYGNPAKFICINKQCRKPGFICSKGQSTQGQCWLFHQKCQKIKWSEIQSLERQNPLTKTSQFINLQDKIENLFLRALQKIQSQHEKFKMWTKTYGHSLQMMKFIKILIDKNYDQLTGQYLSNMSSYLTNKQQKRIQSPTIVQSQFSSVKLQIDRVLEKVGSLYLKTKRTQKSVVYSDINDQLNTSGQNHNAFGNLYNSIQYKDSSIKDHSINSAGIDSKILENLSQIQSYFGNRLIKSSKLIFRASQNGFSIKKFHQICDGIPDTLTLIHNQFNKKLGGYTPVAWTSDKKHWVADKSMKSFIFSIDMNEMFKLNLAQFAIASNPQRGPTFGCCDICIVDNSNKQKSNCEFPISYNNNGKYERGQNASMMFTGHPKGQFLIKEWQVIKLQFE